jgi:hypothetical protein
MGEHVLRDDVVAPRCINDAFVSSVTVKEGREPEQDDARGVLTTRRRPRT